MNEHNVIDGENKLKASEECFPCFRKTDGSVDQRDGCFEGILTFGADLELSIPCTPSGSSATESGDRAPYCKTSFPDRYSVAVFLHGELRVFM